MTYAQIARGVTKWKIPDTPKLRAATDYKFVGKPVARIDQLAKVFGDPIFGMDAELPGMLHATILLPEHIGAALKSVDTSRAESAPGVVKIVQQKGWLG